MLRTSQRLPTIVLVMLWTMCGCGGTGTTTSSAGSQDGGASNLPCDDLIGAGASQTPPNNLPPSPDRVFIGSGDTFFIGTRGRRWGEDVEAARGVLQMKIGIYTLDTHVPQMSIVRADGRASGSAQFAPTSQGLPGPLPTGLVFATPGCWKVEARGAHGSAIIQVQVQNPPAASPS